MLTVSVVEVARVRWRWRVAKWGEVRWWKTTLVLGKQGWRWRWYSVGGLGRSNGSTPIFINKRVWAGVCLGLRCGLVWFVFGFGLFLVLGFNIKGPVWFMV